MMTNGVVKHEVCYQIAGRNMRSKIPALVDAALNDPSILTKHEALESLGLMRAFDVVDLIRALKKIQVLMLEKQLSFVIKRFERLKDQGEYKPSEIL